METESEWVKRDKGGKGDRDGERPQGREAEGGKEIEVT